MTSDIAIYEGGQVDGYRPQIMTPEAAAALDKQVRLCTRAVLREGTDYGVIPGMGEDRKVLLKPGAEKLLQWFGFGFRCDRLEVDTDDDGRKQGVTYRCVITKRIGDPERGLLTEIATCDGYAGYDEPKFYKSAEQAQRDAEAKERHWAGIDRRPANPNKWKNIGEYRAPWNTVIKMAQKRAIVGATIDATAAAGLFADDDNSSAAPADGGPSWYQQALGEASAVRSKAEGDALFAAAAQAGLDGLATPNQVTHVQNRVRQRVARLAPVQVDFEDVPPADPRSSGTAAPEESAGGTRKQPTPAERIEKHFERLGVSDRNDQLILAAQIGRLDDVPAAMAKLTAKQQREILAELEKCRDADALQARLTARQQDADAEVPGE